MENLETLESFERAVAHMCRLFGIEPAVVAADLHPGYLSTRWAEDYAEARHLPLVRVQHHHAHLAALMAEQGLQPHERVLGVIFDGTGYGLDGSVWGGEFLVGGYEAMRRVARLTPVALPASDADVRRVYRLALAHLAAAGVVWTDDLPCVQGCPSAERPVLAQRLRRGVGTVMSSSMGRLFDATASLLGIRHHATYEGQAAIELEALAEETDIAYDFAMRTETGMVEIDPNPVLRAIVTDLRRGVPVPALAGAFHASVARAIAAVARHLGHDDVAAIVALSGGVFQNLRLLADTVALLEGEGARVLVHQKVPPNDGGLALGQAACAAFA